MAISASARTYLCRAFKAYTGKPVVDYLIDRRIQAAMWPSCSLVRLRGTFPQHAVRGGSSAGAFPAG